MCSFCGNTLLLFLLIFVNPILDFCKWWDHDFLFGKNNFTVLYAKSYLLNYHSWWGWGGGGLNKTWTSFKNKITFFKSMFWDDIPYWGKKSSVGYPITHILYMLFEQHVLHLVHICYYCICYLLSSTFLWRFSTRY